MEQSVLIKNDFYIYFVENEHKSEQMWCIRRVRHRRMQPKSEWSSLIKQKIKLNQKIAFISYFDVTTVFASLLTWILIM